MRNSTSASPDLCEWLSLGLQLPRQWLTGLHLGIILILILILILLWLVTYTVSVPGALGLDNSADRVWTVGGVGLIGFGGEVLG